MLLLQPIKNHLKCNLTTSENFIKRYSVNKLYSLQHFGTKLVFPTLRLKTLLLMKTIWFTHQDILVKKPITHSGLLQANVELIVMHYDRSFYSGYGLKTPPIVHLFSLGNQQHDQNRPPLRKRNHPHHITNALS